MLSSDKNIEKIADFVEESRRWLELKADCTRLSLVDKVVRITTGLVIFLVLFAFCMLLLTYLSFAAAIYLGEVLGSAASGYLVISGIYLLLIVLVLLARHSLIERPLVKFLMTILAEDLDDAEDRTYDDSASGKEDRK